MNDIRVIGIGSPFGADRLGWQVIDALRVSAPTLSHVQLLHCRYPAELPNLLAGSVKAILIDALQGDYPLGTLLHLSMPDMPQAGLCISSHGMDVPAALQLTKALGNLPEQLLVLGMEVGKENQPVNPEWIERLVGAVLNALA